MKEQEKFSRSLDFTLKWEGGQNFRIVNGQMVMKDSAKNDSGGVTAFGITALTLHAAHMAGIVSHDDSRTLTLDEAKEIYRAFYWDKYNWGALSWPVCLCCFDCCVNHGGFAYILQRAVNDCGQNVIIDGKFGEKTFDALKSCEPKQLAKAIYHQRFAYFQKIITRDSRQSAFLKGWLRRNDDMAREAGGAVMNGKWKWSVEIMKIYKVTITETLKKGVSVRADNKQEAEQRALDAWRNTEIILEPEDFDGVTVIAEDEGSEDNGSMPYDTVIGGF